MLDSSRNNSRSSRGSRSSKGSSRDGSDISSSNTGSTRQEDLSTLVPSHQLDQILAQRGLQPERPGTDEQGEIIMHGGQDEIRAPPGQDGPDDLLGDGFGRERIREEAIARVEAVEESGAGVALCDEDGAHAGCVVQRRQLGGEPLVEGHGRGLGGAVVDHARSGDVCCYRCDGDDHPVIAGDHVWEERLDQRVVR